MENTQNTQENQVDILEQVSKAEHKVHIEIAGEKSILIYENSETPIEIPLEPKEVKEIIDKYLIRNMIKPAYYGEFLFIFTAGSSEDIRILREAITLLMTFKVIVNDKEFKKFVDIIINLQVIPLLFWYSRVMENAIYPKYYKGETSIRINLDNLKKVVKAFKALYL